MPMMVTRRRLDEGDFDAWKERFEAQSELRAQHGCRGIRRFHGLEDPRELVVIFDWDTVENARAFSNLKLTEKPELLEERDDRAGPKLDIVFMEEMAPLPS